MKKPQKDYIKRQKEQGRKLLNCWVDEKTLIALKSLKNHYQARSRGALIDEIIKEHVNLINKDDPKSLWSQQIEKRLSNLEKHVFEDCNPIEAVQIRASSNLNSSGLPIANAIVGHTEKEIQNLIIKLKDQRYTTKKIAEVLNKEGFRTVRGKKFNFNLVQKQITKMRSIGIDI